MAKICARAYHKIYSMCRYAEKVSEFIITPLRILKMLSSFFLFTDRGV